MAGSAFDDLFQTVKGTATDKQDVGCIDLDKFLMGVFASTLGRNTCHRAFQNLQKGLLHTFSRYITRDRGVFGLAGNFVNLIHVDDAHLCPFHVIIGCLNQLEQNILHIFSHIARLSQTCGICYGKRHVEDLGQSLGQKGLAASGGTEHENVALLQLHVIGPHIAVDPLVVVVNSHSQSFLGLFLPNHIFIQGILDFFRLGKTVQFNVMFFGELFFDDLVTELYTFITDIDPWSSDELFYLLLHLSTERAFQLSFFIAKFEHLITPLTHHLPPLTALPLELMLSKHTIDQTIFYSIFSRHVVVPIRVSLNLFQRLAGVLLQNLIGLAL